MNAGDPWQPWHAVKFFCTHIWKKFPQNSFSLYMLFQGWTLGPIFFSVRERSSLACALVKRSRPGDSFVIFFLLKKPFWINSSGWQHYCLTTKLSSLRLCSSVLSTLIYRFIVTGMFEVQMEEARQKAGRLWRSIPCVIYWPVGKCCFTEQASNLEGMWYLLLRDFRCKPQQRPPSASQILSTVAKRHAF